MRAEILKWIESRLGANPFVLGFNGPQGAGKSTLARWLCDRLNERGQRAVSLSIDDFYLPRTEQMRLAEAYPDNPYLQQRGYPGTHDIPLGSKTLQELKSLGRTRMQIPSYNKSAFQGLGDRKPKSEWPWVEGPLSLILLEGWMLGFAPVPMSKLPNSNFRQINEELADYRLWTEELTGFLQLRADNYRHVLEWRVEAEEKMKASGHAGLSRDAVSEYIAKFLPAYETFLPTLNTGPILGPNRLTVEIGRGRLPD